MTPLQTRHSECNFQTDSMEQSLNRDQSSFTTATATATSLLTESPANTTTTTTNTTVLTIPTAQNQSQNQNHPQSFDPSQSQPQTHQTTNPTSDETPAAPAPEYPHKIHGVGGPTATAPFLQDFNLVAEAAKRAQMAVVMRDLEGISL